MNTQQIERLAYWLWQQRGRPIGLPDDDWFLAEELFRRQYKRFELKMYGTPLFAFGIERLTK